MERTLWALNQKISPNWSTWTRARRDTPVRDRDSLARDRDTPVRDRYSPARDRYTPVRDRDSQETGTVKRQGKSS